MDHPQPYQVAIIGAGAAGLMAAWELAQTGKKVILLEARDRLGGRIHTLKDSRFAIPVELGAEFIHGHLKLTQLLLQKAGVPSFKVSGSIWRKEGPGLEKENDFIENYSRVKNSLESLQHDIPIADFLNQYFNTPEDIQIKHTLKSYVEGYYAADAGRASTFALRDELEKGDDTQYRVAGGYGRLIQYLADELQKKNTPVLLSHPVFYIHWQQGRVQLETPTGSVHSEKLLVTAPLGVLQSGQLKFTPALPEKQAAAQALGFGPVIKIILQFKEPFWKKRNYTHEKNLAGMAFLFSEEEIPTWWTQHPQDVPILAGWLGGPPARKLLENTEEEILQKALASLCRIFSIDAPLLQRSVIASKVTNWAKDPYCCGGYSFEVVGGTEKKKVLGTPVEKTIYFAGEGLYDGPEIGTVEAALAVGRQTAHQIIAGF